MSHSTRVRGLKFHIRRCSYGTYHVALYTSAWIEIELQYCYHNC